MWSLCSFFFYLKFYCLFIWIPFIGPQTKWWNFLKLNRSLLCTAYWTAIHTLFDLWPYGQTLPNDWCCSKLAKNLHLGRSKSRMPRKRQGVSSIGTLTPSQKYHRKRHRSRSSSSENDKPDSESENARCRSRSRTSRYRSRSTRVSNSTTRTESRSRPAFQSVQHVGL